MRLLTVVVLCIASLAVGCGPRGVASESRGESFSEATATARELGAPFADLPPGKIRSLSTEIARFDEPLSLPATDVVGRADAAYAGPRAQPQGIWIHYASGIYLLIDKQDFDAREALARAEAGGVTHVDGTPYIVLETIGGRETLVATAGPLKGPDGRPLHRDAENVVNWSQDGWHYLMTGRGRRPASLDLLKAAAASVP